jgi:membrane protein DedA with SNARE-associated domain
MRLLIGSIITFIVIYLLTFFVINVVFNLDNTNLVSLVSIILFVIVYIYYRFFLKKSNKE